MKKLFIVDASAYIHRAYHAIRPLTTSQGVPTNAVYGFIKLLNKIKKEKNPDYIAVCFDYPSKNFRHTLSPIYKANRKEIDEDLKKQMPIAREAVKAMQLCSLEKEGFEADDIIATVAKKAEEQNIKAIIVTGDKDMFQMVNENINIWNEAKNIMYDNQKVYEKYGIYPDKIVDMLALMGDACDNVIGAAGVGEKTAIKLIQTYGSLEDIIKNADNIKGKLSQSIKDSTENLVLAKKLVKLETNVPLEVSLEDMKFHDNLFENARDFLKKYELFSFITAEDKKIGRFENLQQQTATTTGTQSTSSLRGDNAISNELILPLFENDKEEQNKNGFSIDTFVNDKQRLSSLRGAKSDETILPLKKEHIKIANNVKIIDDEEKLKQLKEKLLVQKEVSVNIETSGSGVMQDLLVGISVCFGMDDNYYIPLNHSDFTLQQIGQETFVKELKDFFENKNIFFIGHDLKFIKHIFDNIGINIKNSSFDVMLASYCINPARQHTIENLSLKYLDFHIKSEEEIFSKGTKKIKADDIDIKILAEYSCSKSVNIFYLKDILTNELKKYNLYSLFADMEMPIMEVLYDMEENGIKIDKEFLNEFDKDLMKEIAAAEQKIYSEADETFNINSPKQLAVILFEKLKLPAIKKTKTGYSTDESVLAELSKYNIATEILKYRELQKLKGTYIEPIKYFLQYEGDRIHTIFNQAVTTTGRLSSSDPNLQNIPVRTEYGKEFRKAFVPEKGNIFISADYSQIDLRSLAHISKDRNLIFAFNSGKDIHTATAQEIFNVKNIEDVTKEQRTAAKSINFGIVYGISSFGLAKQLDIPVKQAKEYIDNYFAKYSGVKNWSARIIEEAKEKGYVKTISGRIRYIPEITSTNKQIVSFGERMALNTPVQGTSADIIKIAMINVAKKIKEQYLKTKILLQVHDDLLLEVPENEKDFVLKILKYEMENAVKLDVPLLVDIKTGTNWGTLTTISNDK